MSGEKKKNVKNKNRGKKLNLILQAESHDQQCSLKLKTSPNSAQISKEIKKEMDKRNSDTKPLNKKRKIPL